MRRLVWLPAGDCHFVRNLRTVCSRFVPFVLSGPVMTSGSCSISLARAFSPADDGYALAIYSLVVEHIGWQRIIPENFCRQITTIKCLVGATFRLSYRS